MQKQSDYSVRFSASSGCNGLMYRIDSKCSFIHEANTASSSKFLESNLQRYDSRDSIYTTSKIPSYVVEKFSQHAERQIFSVSDSVHNRHDRCFNEWFWGIRGEEIFSRSMDSDTEKVAHKLSRNEGSLSDNKTFYRSPERQISSDQKRQHQCCPIYKSSGRHQISESLLFGLGSLADGHTKQYSSEGHTYSGKEKCFGRSIEQNKGTSDRMDSAQVHCQSDLQCLGYPTSRPFCVMGEQTDKHFLFMDSSSKCIRTRCIDDSMAGHVRLRVSTNLSDTENTATYEAIQVPNNSYCSTMAKETLVFGNSRVTNCASNQTSDLGESVESAQNQNSSPRATNAESDSMAPLNRNFKAEGFSESVTNLLGASWRKGTRQDYIAKFQKFSSWCSEKQIDPYSATLKQISDFLASLFDSGLQYRTISGYRSMLSAVLKPIENHLVGQHPYITRLIKGVFNSRPPQRKLLPEWDLGIVLKALEKDPFEPLKEAYLKYITFKAVFLVAITTFRRCSDLQSLRIESQSMQIQSKGITFIRHGLSKQDRQNHFGAKIHVPSFSEKESLDPKRAISIYLEKTKEIRQKLNVSDRGKLFLAIKEPHKPVTSVTIANWIVQTVKEAYSDKSLKVNAHSTRAIAPSWALYKGATTKSILDAADWSSESTFVNFYLRDLEANKVLQ